MVLWMGFGREKGVIWTFCGGKKSYGGGGVEGSSGRVPRCVRRRHAMVASRWSLIKPEGWFSRQDL